ncbi:MAG: thioredoxin domain-containing protein [Rubrobacteraceae bacterium]|nr:thioredoxin domain-containing protein [Rubrobacteraceae bacterium]
MEPKLYKEYVEDGTLRIEWRDFPYRGQESVNAAVAARSAQAQGKFWEYHDLLYDNQASGYSDENLLSYAKEAGLDTRRFEDDYESARYAGLVQADFQRGQNIGVNGTPTFFINDQVLVGLQPLGVFESVIEDARREAEGG